MRKFNAKELEPVKTVGLDLGDRWSVYVVLTPEGETIEGRVATTAPALQKTFGGMEPARIALEAGTHSGWVSRLLRGLGHEALVANPRKLRLIYENACKSDRADAEWLARLARVDPQLLAPIRHRGERAQRDLQTLRLRQNLVASRARLINGVRSAAKTAGRRLPKCSSGAFAKRAGEEMHEGLLEAAGPALEAIARLSEQIRAYDARIAGWLETRYPEAKRMAQIQGVGPLTAVAFLLTLESPERLRSSRQAGALLGLCPRRDQSGDHNPQLRISKAGDRYLRGLLVSCAHYMLGPFGQDSDLRRHGEKIAARGGKNAKKRAVVAVARKLAVLMHRLWRTGEVWEPLHNANKLRAA